MNRSVPFLVLVAFLVFLTSSFDIFLTINLGPNIRISQLFVLALFAAALVSHRMGLTLLIPLGGQYLLAWWCVQLAFVPVVEFWQKSLAYAVWLGLDIALVFAMVNLFATGRNQIEKFLKLYLVSYVLIAWFGIVQFVLPIIGGPSLLVQQWWLLGRVPRANGFSYEPSYYATYLIMGVCTLGSLRRSGVGGFRSKRWAFGYFAIIFAIVASSSRMGIIFLLLELAILPLRWLRRVIRTPRLILALPVLGRRTILAVAFLLCACIALPGIVRWSLDNLQTIEIFANGTGLMGTSSYSIDERGDHLTDTLRTISDHPWIGRSLGGITESIARYRGAKPNTFDEAKDYEGQSVFAEVIAASGIPGSIPFFCFVVITIFAPLRLANRSTPLQAAWLRALVYGLVIEWGILQLNQNILRLYLWVHIAALATLFSYVKCQQHNRGEQAGTSTGWALS